MRSLAKASERGASYLCKFSDEGLCSIALYNPSLRFVSLRDLVNKPFQLVALLLAQSYLILMVSPPPSLTASDRVWRACDRMSSRWAVFF